MSCLAWSTRERRGCGWAREDMLGWRFGCAREFARRWLCRASWCCKGCLELTVRADREGQVCWRRRRRRAGRRARAVLVTLANTVSSVPLHPWLARHLTALATPACSAEPPARELASASKAPPKHVLTRPAAAAPLARAPGQAARATAPRSGGSRRSSAPGKAPGRTLGGAKQQVAC